MLFIYLFIYLFFNIHRSFIFNSPKLEITQMSISRWMDKHCNSHVVEYHWAMKKEWITDLCNNVNDFIFFVNFFFWLCVPCGVWDLSSPAKDRTCAPCSRSAESLPLDCQGSPCESFVFNWIKVDLQYSVSFRCTT